MILLALRMKLSLLTLLQPADASATTDFSAQVAPLLAALKDHRFAFAGAVLVNVLVTVAKQGWFSNAVASKLPARYIPFVAVGLGVLGVSSAEVVAGLPWSQALFDGLAAGVTAVFGHQAIVEAGRNGREVVPSAPWAPAEREKTSPGPVN
jgi:hypothetical protein